MIITLRGPKSTISVSTNGDSNIASYEKFIEWLNYYYPANGWINFYPIESENKILGCRLKAQKLGLVVTPILKNDKN